MKIQLDTSQKTITVEQDINMLELLQAVKKLLPNDWKEFTLQTHTTINNWNSPTIIHERYPHWHDYDWQKLPWYTTTGINDNEFTDSMKNVLKADMKVSSMGHDAKLENGIFNIEV